ncbi:cyclopropane-fatty-acyl-phospholipid synthase family protein [uncultured Lentibacter sp.]|uniref:SAM-dependent methyltransferase n=1 Tax=uncultured Lentibacter sp. TaxID=1659309 RepID=UPI002607104E|nr:cyclopropane-fatty-acyl-phospholipid synthase family protein [uncultured Lentibacter sp.]
MILTETKGQKNLPRYFSQVFEAAQRISRGQLDITLPDGRLFRAIGQQAGPVAAVHIHDPDVFARLLRDGELGFCDAYLEQGWSSPDLQAFLDLMNAGNEVLYRGFPGKGLLKAYERLRHILRSNSKARARKNIAYHYDLGNAFYAKWLDETMTYSSALFKTGNEPLAVAQRAKYAALVDALNVKEGDHILEIGCGWGGFAEYAAKERGLRVTGLTISAEQLRYAQARMARAGVADRVDLRMQDYRDEHGVYDGIASIEMFEAVGEKYWPVYFDKLQGCLKPEARACLQIITLQEARFEVYRKGVDFIQKYIFPGGMLPSKTVLRQQVLKAGLEEVGCLEFGESYSKTLRHWHERFNADWADISQMGFDERFRRMWNFYLTSCAASFRGGNCDVVQITLVKRV